MSQSQNVKLISGAQNYQGQEKAELLTVLEEKLERHDPRHAWHPGFLDVASWERRRRAVEKSGEIFLVKVPSSSCRTITESGPSWRQTYHCHGRCQHCEELDGASTDMPSTIF